MFPTEKRYLSISINEACIKLAQLTSSGLVEKVARATAADASAGEISKSLKVLLNSFDRKADVICVIPANAASTKNIEVPSSNPEEIKSIINLQASRYTPYSREEVLISFVNLGMSSADNTRVLLVIAHRNVVKERIAALEGAGLSPDKILFVPEGIARFYAKALNLKKDGEAVGIIDISLHSVNYMVAAKGSLVFARSIPLGIKAIMEDADAHTKLIEEINKSVAAFVNEETGTAPESYVVTTDHEAVKNILPVLNEGLKVNCSASPFTNFIKGAGVIKQKLQNELGDDSFLDVIAPVVALSKTEVNLMPEEMILKKTVERQSKEASTAGITAVALMVLVGAMIISRIYFKETFLNENLRKQYAPQHEEVLSLQAKMAKTDIIRQYLQNRMVSLDTIHELYTITPKEIYLTAVNMDEEGNISIVGVSESMSLVFTYVKALDNSKAFTNVKTKSTATRKENGKDVAAFEITFKLEEA